MSMSIDELREMYTEEREEKKVLKEMVDRQDRRIDRLVNENNRLGDELQSARNDNGRKSSTDEETKRKLQSELDAARSSIGEVHHDRKEMEQELFTERRGNARLQASLEQVQDENTKLHAQLEEVHNENKGLQASLEQVQGDYADLSQTLEQVRQAWDNQERSRASDVDEGHQEEEQTPLVEQQRRVAEGRRLQEWEQNLIAKAEELQEWDQRLQAQQHLIREQQSNLPVAKPETLDSRLPPGNAMADKALSQTDKGKQKPVEGSVSSGIPQVGSNAPPKGALPSGARGPPQHTRRFQPQAPNRKPLVPTITSQTEKPKTADGFTHPRKGKFASANWGRQDPSNAGPADSNKYALLATNPEKMATPLVAQAQTVTKTKEPGQSLPSANAPTQVRPLFHSRSDPAALPEAAVKQWEEAARSRGRAPMAAPGTKLRTGLENQGSRSGAAGPVKTEPSAQPKVGLNPGALPFRPVGPKPPTEPKTMAEIAIEPPPPVVSRPKEKDVTKDFIASFLAQVKAEKAAKADAVSKSKIPDTKRIKDAAPGGMVKPGKPKPKSQTTGTSAPEAAAPLDENVGKPRGPISREEQDKVLRPQKFDWSEECAALDRPQSSGLSGKPKAVSSDSPATGGKVPVKEHAGEKTLLSSQADNVPQDKTKVENPSTVQANPVTPAVTGSPKPSAVSIVKDQPVPEKVEQALPTETANPEPGAADVAKTKATKVPDLPPHAVITGKKTFDEEVMFKGQQPGPSKSKGGKNKKFASNKDLLDREREKANAGSGGAEAAGQK